MTSALSLPVTPESGVPLAQRRLAYLLPALIALGYLAAAVALTWRLWADPSSAMVAGNPTDNDLFAWFMRYAATAVLHGHFPALITTSMNIPTGINLMWNTSLLLPAIFLTPVTALAGPQASLTVLVTVGFAGSAASMFYLLRRLRLSLAAAAVGGAVYGFSPALLHTAVGHYNLQFAVLLPLIIDAGLRLYTSDTPAWRSGIWLGLLVTAQLLISEELLFGTAIAAALVTSVLAASRPRMAAARARHAARGLLVAIGVVLVLAGWPLWVQFFGPLTQHGSSFIPNFYENDVAGFVVPSSAQFLHTAASAAAAARYQGGTSEYVAYLGFPLLFILACVAVAFWRHLAVRAAAVTFIVFAVLSLGGRLLLNGHEYPNIPLPWALLSHFPIIESALPNRLSIFVDGAAAVLLACGIDFARKRLGNGPPAVGLVALAVAVTLASLLPRPLPESPAAGLPTGWNAAFSALHLRPGATVLVIPVPTATLTAALRWQAESGDRISLIGGYFQGPAFNGHAYIDGNGFPPLAAYLNDLYSGNVALTSPSTSQARSTLARWDPAAVVAAAGSRPALRAYLVGLLGPPTLSTGDMLVWRHLVASG